MPDQPVVPVSQPSQPVVETTPSTTAPGEAPVSRAEMQQFGQALVGAMQGLSQQVARAQQPAPAVADPRDPGTQILTRVAAGDLSDVDRRVDARLTESGLVGFLGARAAAEAASNEQAVRARVDAEFGAGTYDSELKGIVENQLGESVAARSLPQAWDNALSMAKGQKFGALSTRFTAVQKAASDAAAAAETARNAAPWMPGNGIPPSQSNRLDEGDTLLMQKISGKVGGRVPKAEEAAKLRDLMWRRGADGVSMEDIEELGISIPAH